MDFDCGKNHLPIILWSMFILVSKIRQNTKRKKKFAMEVPLISLLRYQNISTISNFGLLLEDFTPKFLQMIRSIFDVTVESIS